VFFYVCLYYCTFQSRYCQITACHCQTTAGHCQITAKSPPITANHCQLSGGRDVCIPLTTYRTEWMSYGPSAGAMEWQSDTAPTACSVRYCCLCQGSCGHSLTQTLLQSPIPTRCDAPHSGSLSTEVKFWLRHNCSDFLEITAQEMCRIPNDIATMPESCRLSLVRLHRRKATQPLCCPTLHAGPDEGPLS
jgi:hypothetical protein